MWTPCTTVLDEPIKVFFWDLEDFQVLGFAPFPALFLVGPYLAFGGAVVAGIVVYHVKKGKPSGALRHLLHWLDLWRIPGVLPAHPLRYAPR